MLPLLRVPLEYLTAWGGVGGFVVGAGPDTLPGAYWEVPIIPGAYGDEEELVLRGWGWVWKCTWCWGTRTPCPISSRTE